MRPPYFQPFPWIFQGKNGMVTRMGKDLIFTTRLMTLLFLGLGLGQQTFAEGGRRCETVHIRSWTTILQNNGFPANEAIFNASSGRSLVFKARLSTKGPQELAVVNIHGLAENVHTLDRYAHLWAARDVNVVSVGMHGSDLMSLRVQEKAGTLPNKFDPQDLARDIVEYAVANRFQKIILTGHSMGAIVSTFAAPLLKQRGIHVAVAFVSGPTVGKKVWDPLSRITQNEQQRQRLAERGPRYADAFVRLGINRNLAERRDQDQIPFSDADLNLLIEGGYRQMLGIRELDFLDASDPHGLYAQLRGIPFLVIGGSKDILVTPDDLRHFAIRLNHSSVPVSLTILDSPLADHRQIIHDPETIFRRVEAFADHSLPSSRWWERIQSRVRDSF